MRPPAECGHAASPAPAPALPWRPLTRPVRVFGFDFAASPPAQLLTPGRATLAAPALAAGTVHAVLFWFDLTLAEGGEGEGGGGGGAPVTLSTSPHAPPGAQRPSWGQAVAWLPPAAVDRAGDTIALEATHDTYGIAFTHSPAGQQRPVAAGGDGAAAAAADAFIHPALSSTADAAAAAAKAVASGVAHDPRAAERLARGALIVGARPGEWGLDAAAAAGVCGGLVGGG